MFSILRYDRIEVRNSNDGLLYKAVEYRWVFFMFLSIIEIRVDLENVQCGGVQKNE